MNRIKCMKHSPFSLDGRCQLDARHEGLHVDQEKKTWDGVYDEVGTELIMVINKTTQSNIAVTISNTKIFKTMFEYVASRNDYHHVDECEYPDEDRASGPVPWEDLD